MSKYFGKLFRGLSFFTSSDPGDLENGDIYYDSSAVHKAKQNDTVIDLTTPRNVFKVRVATTTSGTLSSDFQNSSTVDGITLATGDLILIKDQSTGSENGLYTVQASGSPVRRFDYASDSDVRGTLVLVKEGTSNGGKVFKNTNSSTITVGTTALTYSEFGSSASTIPPGIIMPFAGSGSVPSGYLPCDGSAISRTTYADLFSVIGTTWGNGDGSTTFNIPDLQGMFLRGSGTHGSQSKAAGGNFAGGSVGDYQEDKSQGHIHWDYNGTNYMTHSLVCQSGTDRDIARYAAGSDSGFITAPQSDGTNGTPRTGNETKPASYSVNWMIKY